MKQSTLETVVIFTKGFCVSFGAFCLALAGSLAQWANSGDLPTVIEWIIIGGTSIGAGVAALGGFLSSAFGKWMANGNGSDLPPKP